MWLIGSISNSCAAITCPLLTLGVWCVCFGRLFGRCVCVDWVARTGLCACAVGLSSEATQPKKAICYNNQLRCCHLKRLMKIYDIGN